MALKVMIHGASGHIGQILLDRISHTDDFELAAAVAHHAEEDILSSLSDYQGPADVLIDFSNHAATRDIMEYCTFRRIPAVIATTGQTEEELALIAEASKTIPVFRSANMSVGIALLQKLVKEAAKVFPDADVEILEAHHNRKLDAPSGTALMLADAVKEVRSDAEYVEGRSGHHARQPQEIGISALRMGNVVGEHEVFLNTGTQMITLRHSAFDRALFADGALEAAKFLAGKPAGLYNMQDMIG
ncbi:4-hydroxy-tetrahydrodipicolinate reductase [Eubacterium pyruvativorans]|uniref:4-hydroxy-tetrahydrodipicolinate reductase n=2 Tax=Eubacterium pyruvativorans TaxID=155865 RepID=UPI0013D668FB|nr:4-hydroxy-tetrahydrodipicolinate reductase [Eubacterium pyruvativorans]MCI5747582.1 4-hydroxy-tetrahydrodipicolinate reductase [Eubacterium pyruvativorans]MDD7683965.1 4-hydroxy-tetrahydrodipicolinate reductase [Eubacterium pyruvativorans]MDY4049363.1 4-hydroxy-tetrahydrodipicolinate reductase [Eubacterium pyruvativorans]